MREITFKRFKKLSEYNFMTLMEYSEYPYRAIDYLFTLGLYDWALSSKRSVNDEVFFRTIN